MKYSESCPFVAQNSLIMEYNENSPFVRQFCDTKDYRLYGEMSTQIDLEAVVVMLERST